MDDPGFVKAYRDAERPGVYCRVIAEGKIAAGFSVSHEPYAGERIGAVEMFRDWFIRKKLSAADLRKTLAAPIAVRARADWEKLLARAEGVSAAPSA
jgi:MOSC domain-containing protein YiiM